MSSLKFWFKYNFVYPFQSTWKVHYLIGGKELCDLSDMRNAIGQMMNNQYVTKITTPDNHTLSFKG